jgi:hypothetical protein
MMFLFDVSRHIAKAAALAFGVVMSSVPALADQPSLLTLRNGSDPTVEVSLQDLDSLPQYSFETTTQWTDGLMMFSGPALKDVLVKAGTGGDPSEVIHLIAANQYEVILDPNLLEDTVPIVATRINGKTFGIRDKGPLWVVFPYDLDTEYQKEGVYSASIWQLVDIFIENM